MVQADITEFIFPGKVVRRAGASGDVGSLLLAQGVTSGSVVILADRVVHQNGLAARLLEGLADAGYTPQMFAEITGEPELDMVEMATAIAADSSAVAFVGIGGGSALDTAKLVAYVAATGSSLRELKGPVPRVPGFKPLVLVPTTVGTGAEATRVAMFSVDGAKRAVLSSQFVPDIAVLDQELVKALPGSVVASTALDALSHSIESMMSTTSNELTWLFAGDAARRIFANLPTAFEGDPAARSELLYASFLAGVALNAGVVLGHSMSYVLAARHHLAHGVGCAIALPYCIAYNQGMPAQAAADLAAAVLSRTDATLFDVAQAAQTLTEVVGVPTDLSAFSTPVEDLPRLAESVVRDYPRPTNPVTLEPGRLANLMAFLRTGDLIGAWTAMGDPS
ncbi:iron-containing alcohol dehydrogenase [Acidothermaceae bacterium B102]|nr:iron-containing alcohol dehydrogenase [Acidothermaceae bacterium B102]